MSIVMGLGLPLPFLVKKKVVQPVSVLIFRKISDVIQKDAQPLAQIDDTLDALGDACYFSTLDLASGYWQVELDPQDGEITVLPHRLGYTSSE